MMECRKISHFFYLGSSKENFISLGQDKVPKMTVSPSSTSCPRAVDFFFLLSAHNIAPLIGFAGDKPDGSGKLGYCHTFSLCFTLCKETWERGHCQAAEKSNQESLPED